MATRSSFNLNAGSAGYAAIREPIRSGFLPPPLSVSVEQMLNHFPLELPQVDLPLGSPVLASMEVAAAPWAPNHRLVAIGIAAREAAEGELRGSLAETALEVGIEVRFNTARVLAYRLIEGGGFFASPDGEPVEGQMIAQPLAPGTRATALYELVPQQDSAAIDEGELMRLFIGYRAAEGGETHLVSLALTDNGADFASSSTEFKFAAAVAGFGMILKQSPHSAGFTFAEITEWARAGSAHDAGGERSEFLALVHRARTLANRP